MGEDRGGEVIKGTLEMIVLEVLQREPMQAWGITEPIERRSDGTVEREPRSTRRCTVWWRAGGSHRSGARRRTTARLGITRSREWGGGSWRLSARNGRSCRGA